MNLLAADLGGTKTLLAIYKWDGELTKVYQKRYSSTQWDSLELIISDFKNSIPNELDFPKYGCIAVAGLIRDNIAHITNLGWKVSSAKIKRHSKLKRLELVNDFSVLINGLKYFKPIQYSVIQEGVKTDLKNAVVAFIGAGTGLGIARGININGEFTPIASEGGHREFSPRSEEELDLANWLKKEFNLKRISIERVVSGTGLGNIARWQLSKSKNKKHPLNELARNWIESKNDSLDFPAMVCKEAEKGDELMQTSLNFWLSAYGSSAGDLAIHELSSGGLWIGGGTAIKHLVNFRTKTFLNAFYNKGRFKEFLGEIPVKVLVDPEAGIFSAACRARSLAESDEKLT